MASETKGSFLLLDVVHTLDYLLLSALKPPACRTVLSCRVERAATTDEGPLCFVLPSATKKNLQNLHYIYSTRVVRKGDVLLNVFPKHQAEIEAYPYPVPVEQVLDPAQFAHRLCDCRAVIASRLHGAIMALQAGVPTIAAWPAAEDNKVPDLMNDVLQLPDQFVLVNNSFSRGSLTRMVNDLRRRYPAGRRDLVLEKLESIALQTQRQTALMLANVTGLQPREEADWPSMSSAGGFWGDDEPPELEQGKKLEKVKIDTAKNVEAEARPTGEAGGKQTPHKEFFPTPTERVRTAWRSGGTASPAPPAVGGEFSRAGSIYVALAALAMIAVLGLPGLASRSRDTSVVLPPRLKRGAFASVAGAAGVSAGEEDEEHEEESQQDAGEPAKVSAGPLCDSRFAWAQQLRISDVAFFGLNYIVWVVLAMGFNMCSKTYMRETRNPVALLAIQSWIGIGVLWILNQNGVSSRRSLSSSPAAASPSPGSFSSTAPSSSVGSAGFSRLSASWAAAGPSWAGKCGLREAKRLGKDVWQAALLHCCNAVLTSWSVLVGGVAATHALKALEPVAAAGFSRWLLGSSLPPGRAAAVVVIVLGLAILMLPLHLPRWAGGTGVSSDNKATILMVSGQELAFPAVITACACCAVALRNVLLKKADPSPPPPPLGLLACSVVGALVGSMALLVPWLPFSWEWAGNSLLRTSGVNAALCSVGYNLASFNLLSELSPVGHAVGNASKRVVLFASGLFLLGEEGSLSPRQLAGASVAFVGLASYNLTGIVAAASPGSR